MKASERVLLPNGQWAEFPKRYEERALATGAKEFKGEPGLPDPNLPRVDAGQSEVEAKAAAQKKAQEYAEKNPQPTTQQILDSRPTGGEKVEDPLLPRKNNAKKELAAKRKKATKPEVPHEVE